MKTFVNIVQLVALGLVVFTVVMLFANEPDDDSVTVDSAEAADFPEVEAAGAVYASQCASCHGAEGQGVIGPSLQNIADSYSVEEQTVIVTDGRGGMPSFGGRLTDEEIALVVRYTREVLAQG